jgi:hypothetical protein
MRHSAALGVGIVLYLSVTGLSGGLQAQTGSNSQASSAGQSLGDYARQVRKEPDGKPKKKVFDNDNLPKVDKLSVVGNAAAPAAEAAPAESKPAETANAGPAKSEAGAPPADSSKMDQAQKEAAWKQWSDKIKSQLETIDLLTRELDVVQREYQIRAAAMYADAGNRLRNSADWDKQDAQYKQQIADKQKALDDGKQKLEDLREEARKAGVPSSVREQ